MFVMENRMITEKLKRLEMRVAAVLLNMGVTRRRIWFNVFYFLLPGLIRLALTLEELYRPSNGVFWYYDPTEPDNHLEPMLEDVSEIINRAPTPLGQDDYIILVLQFASMPGDEDGLTGDGIEASLPLRRVLSDKKLSGNRWKDWKQGKGKDELRQVLNNLVPTSDAPVVMVQAAVIGAVFHRLHARFAEG